MSGLILAFGEQRNNAFRKPAFEVTSAAARLAKETGGEAASVVIGSDVGGIAPELAKFGAARIAVCDNETLKEYNGELYAAALSQVAASLNPSVILFPASTMGKDLAPRVAALLGTGIASDCIEVKAEGGKVQARRPIFAGKVHAWVEAAGDRFIATLRPNVFTAEESAGAGTVEAIDFAPPEGGPKAVLKEILQEASGKIELTEADIIVSGGRGMKGPENYKLLEDLASHLKGATVGASRASVDAGWRPHADQVGQTGKTVSPTLYIACGISGAIQHLAGMSSSKYIVAINKDPDAPIFKIADYGIVGDLFEVVPAMIEEAKKL